MSSRMPAMASEKPKKSNIFKSFFSRKPKELRSKQDDFDSLSRSMRMEEKVPSYPLMPSDLNHAPTSFAVLRAKGPPSPLSPTHSIPSSSSPPSKGKEVLHLPLSVSNNRPRPVSLSTTVSEQDIQMADQAIVDLKSDLRKSFISTLSLKRPPSPIPSRASQASREMQFSTSTMDEESQPRLLQQADDYIQQAVIFHEANQLDKATEYFKLAADQDSALGNLLYGLSLRHGWGCDLNPVLAVQYLQRAAESAVFELHSDLAKATSNPVAANTKLIARQELVLAIYEIGQSFYRGWGVPKQKKLAIHYFEIAASLGDPDAQNALADCLYRGDGVKRDKKKAAKYYRMAAAQGSGIIGNSWIYKQKYLDDGEEVPDGVVA